jgi:hypothetical protein
MLNAPAAAAAVQLGKAVVVALAGVAVIADSPTTAATAKTDTLFFILIPILLVRATPSERRTIPKGGLQLALRAVILAFALQVISAKLVEESM